MPSDQIRYSKGHVEYWRVPGRLFQQRGSTDYCCRFSHNGRRGFFDLNTSNRSDAAKRACERYKYVVAHGWEKAQKNSEFRVQAPVPTQSILTVGGWVKTAGEILVVRPITLSSYSQALRRLAAEAVLGISYSVKNHEQWIRRVDEVPLMALTGNAVARWIKHRISEAKNPVDEEKAKHTVNHVLRSAKALFSTKKVLSLIAKGTLELLPTPVPLSDVRLFKEDSSARFTPAVDPEKLFRTAFEHLGREQRNGEDSAAYDKRHSLWVAFLLTFCAALRRKEADLLIWRQVVVEDLARPLIKLGITEHLKPKNAAHAKAIPLDLEVAAIFRKDKAEADPDSFVLCADVPPSVSVRRPRCFTMWRQLNQWLKGLGIEDPKPVHSMRKSMGAFMAAKHGIHAAQRLLRHTTPVITSKYYSDSEARESAGLGSLLKE